MHPTKPLLIVGGGAGAAVDVWELAGERQARFIRSLQAPSGTMAWVDGAALTPDGSRLAMAASEAFGSKSTVYVLDLDSGAVVARGREADGNVQQLVATQHAEIVAYLSTGGTLYFWESATGSKARVIANDLGRDGKLSLASKGQWLVSAANDVCVWEVPSGRLLRRLGGHPGVWHLTLLGRGEALTATKDWMVSLWDIEAGTEIVTLGLDDEARNVSLDRDGRTLVVGDGRGDVYAFQLVRSAQRSIPGRAGRPSRSRKQRGGIGTPRQSSSDWGLGGKTCSEDGTDRP